jgi:putative oxidoreductase
MSKGLNLLSTSNRYNDIGILIIRVVSGGALVLKHGVEKAFDFHTMATNTTLPFPDPIHIGVVPSLVIALISDFFCGIFVILGLGTRWAAAFSFVNILVAFITVHHWHFFGRDADHGEIIVLMLGAMAGFVFTGPGRYSVDYLVTRRRGVISGRANENEETGVAHHAG